MQIPLQDLADINLGYPFRGSIKESPGAGVVAVQMKNVSSDASVDWSGCVETKLQGKTKVEWLLPGDILFAARGNRNYAALIDQTIEDRQAVASPHFYIVRCDTTKVLPEYLCWLLNHGPCQRYFEREAEGTFTKSIRRNVLAQSQIALPSLEKQHSIIRLADTIRRQQQLLQTQIQNNQKLMAGLASEIYQSQQGGAHG